MGQGLAQVGWVVGKGGGGCWPTCTYPLWCGVVRPIVIVALLLGARHHVIKATRVMEGWGVGGERGVEGETVRLQRVMVGWEWRVRGEWRARRCV